MTTTILPTIERQGGTLVVASETIANGAGTEHRSVLQLIQAHKEALASFGEVAFDVRAGYNNAKVRTALLSEPQSTLLLTFMKNTIQIVQFKIALVKAFYEMKCVLDDPKVREAVFGTKHEGFTTGQPVITLPNSAANRWVDPRMARNARIAEIVKEAGGAWLPVTVDEFTLKQHTELARAINYGARKAFPHGAYTAAMRDGELYIRHNKKKVELDLGY